MELSLELSDADSLVTGAIEQLPDGDDLILTKNGQPIAVVNKHESKQSWPSKPGTASHYSFWMADDFNEPYEYEDAESDPS